MTLETLVTCLGALGLVQASYMFLKSRADAGHRYADGTMGVGSRDTFIGDSAAVGRERARIKKQQFEIARAKAIMTMAEHFAASKAKA